MTTSSAPCSASRVISPSSRSGRSGHSLYSGRIDRPGQAGRTGRDSHPQGTYERSNERGVQPDGQRIASASTLPDPTVKVWDAVTGQEIHTLKGHTHSVVRVAFSPDGQRIASASGDKTVKVWDAVTGQETLTLNGHTGGVISVAFSLDGQRLVSVGEDGTVKVWELRGRSTPNLRNPAQPHVEGASQPLLGLRPGLAADPDAAPRVVRPVRVSGTLRRLGRFQESGLAPAFSHDWDIFRVARTMDPNLRKEHLRNAYFRAGTAAAGFQVYKPEPDVDKMDGGIAAPGPKKTVRLPKVEIPLNEYKRRGTNPRGSPYLAEGARVDIRDRSREKEMATVIVEVPDMRFRRCGVLPRNSLGKMRIAAAIQWYHQELISQGMAARSRD